MAFDFLWSLEDEESVCVFCNNEDVNYLEQTVKFLTSKCGHQICESCKTSKFRDRRSMTCPACNQIIRKNTLSDKSKDELDYKASIDMRKKIAQEFNKTIENFTRSCDYRDYQELVETITYNKIHNLDVEWTENEIQQNKKENLAIIAENKSKKAEADRLYREARRAEEEKKTRIAEEIAQLESKKKKEKEIERRQAMEVLLGERETTDAETRRQAELHQKVLPKSALDNANSMATSSSAFIKPKKPIFAVNAAQPKVLSKTLPDFSNIDRDVLRKRRRLAGGYKAEIVECRTRHLMVSGLLLSAS